MFIYRQYDKKNSTTDIRKGKKSEQVKLFQLYKSEGTDKEIEIYEDIRLQFGKDSEYKLEAFLNIYFFNFSFRQSSEISREPISLRVR